MIYVTHQVEFLPAADLILVSNFNNTKENVVFVLFSSHIMPFC